MGVPCWPELMLQSKFLLRHISFSHPATSMNFTHIPKLLSTPFILMLKDLCRWKNATRISQTFNNIADISRMYAGDTEASAPADGVPMIFPTHSRRCLSSAVYLGLDHYLRPLGPRHEPCWCTWMLSQAYWNQEPWMMKIDSVLLVEWRHSSFRHAY